MDDNTKREAGSAPEVELEQTEQWYWSESPESKRFHIVSWVVFYIWVIVSLGLEVYLIWSFMTAQSNPFTYGDLVGFMISQPLGLGIILVIPLGIWQGVLRARVKDRFYRDYMRGQINQMAKPGSGIAHEREWTFNDLWVYNQQRMQVYHDLATVQSRRSFNTSQVAIVTSFLLVAALGVVATQAETTTGAVVAGAVAAISAATSGYIGATFLRAQAEAAAQLREFFLQPVEVARALSAERLVSKRLDGDEASQAVQEIVRGIMAPPTATRKVEKVA